MLRGVNLVVHKITTRTCVISLTLRCLLVLCFLFGGFFGVAQTKITLQQAGSRVPPDFAPKYEGEEILVSGQVSAPPIWITDSYYVAIQDAGAYGLLLQGAPHQFLGLEPGDWVEAQGLLARRGGRPVLLPRDVRRIGHDAPPAPKKLKPAELASFRYLGVLVSTDSMVIDQDQNAGGDQLVINSPNKDLSVLLPRARRDSGPQLTGFRPGDRIRVTGIASQNCTLPPYDRYFQILIPAPSSVVILERGWLIQPPVLLAALILAGGLAMIWWFRERRMANLRKQMRLMNALGEDVVSASSPAEVLRRLNSGLPALSNGASVGLYIQNRGTKMLEGVLLAASPERNKTRIGAGSDAETNGTAPAAPATVPEESIDPEAPGGGVAAAVASCFHKRTLVAIPDTRRSASFRTDPGVAAPRSLLLVPMLAQNDVVGVLVLDHSDRVHYFSDAEQAAIQHLANQVATALRLQEQQAIREQLFRSEKLAASGQLISAVANELQSPLESINSLASALQSRVSGEPAPELSSISDEARRASHIVSRLVSFAKVEQSQVEPVDLTALLTSLLKFRSPEWKAKEIDIKVQLAEKSAVVMASPAQLEQVLLNMLVEAEKSAAAAAEKSISISSSMLAKHVLVEVTFPAQLSDFDRSDSSEEHPAFEALGLAVSRGIIQSYGGEFRVARLSPSLVRFEAELPVMETAVSGFADLSVSGDGARPLTALVVEPDTKMQRQLVQLLGARGDRAVPVSSAEEGADVAQRVRFDVVICAVRLPGLNWVEFFERVRHRVGGFVLLTDGFDQALGRAFKNGEGFVLSKPVEEAELLRICRTIEERVAVGS